MLTRGQNAAREARGFQGVFKGLQVSHGGSLLRRKGLYCAGNLEAVKGACRLLGHVTSDGRGGSVHPHQRQDLEALGPPTGWGCHELQAPGPHFNRPPVCLPCSPIKCGFSPP